MIRPTQAHNPKTQALAAWLGVCALAGFAALAQAQALSTDDYRAALAATGVDHEADTPDCGDLPGNRRDICMAQVKGLRAVAMADQQARQEPSAKHRYDASMARADSLYDVALERCDDHSGKDKEVCVREANAERVHAQAEAKAQLRAAETRQVAMQGDDRARRKALDTVAQARTDATSDKREADYLVAKARCDARPAAVRDTCLGDAKARFGMH